MLGWLDEQRRQGQAIAAWSDPEGGLDWVASGAVLSTEASDLKELAKADSSWSELTGDVDPALPLAWTGAAFDPLRSGGVWEGWPAALAVVPRLLVWVRRPAARPPLPAELEAASWDRDPPPSPQAGLVVRARSAAQAQADLVETRRALAALVTQAPGRPAPPERSTPEEPAAWAERVRAAEAALGGDPLRKLVLARAVGQALPAGCSWDLSGTLARLRDEDRNAIVYAFAPAGGEADAGCFLGATPELLVRVRGHQVEAVALAGTTRRGRDEADDAERGRALLASDKDRREHALVVEALRAALRPACRVFYEPPEPALKRLPRLFHLETRFLGVLTRPDGALTLGAALHPTPAVAGAPRQPALEWLRAHEPLARGWFAGPVGWVDGRGGGALAVALRCALLRGPVAWSFAGAGVVRGSDPRAEWLETEGKLATMARALLVREAARGEPA